MISKRKLNEVMNSFNFYHRELLKKNITVEGYVSEYNRCRVELLEFGERYLSMRSLERRLDQSTIFYIIETLEFIKKRLLDSSRKQLRRADEHGFSLEYVFIQRFIGPRVVTNITNLEEVSKYWNIDKLIEVLSDL
ncbi:MAG: hypothetical protein AABW46_01605 [Nanoarchaeota archaeon]